MVSTFLACFFVLAATASGESNSATCGVDADGKSTCSDDKTMLLQGGLDIEQKVLSHVASSLVSVGAQSEAAGASSDSEKVVKQHLPPADRAAELGQSHLAASQNSSFVVTLINAMIKNATDQLEHELKPGVVPLRNKVVLSLIEVFMLGVLGIDRCYSGQLCCGLVKGLTLGGLGFWAFIDYWVVIVNCLAGMGSLPWVGFNLKFEVTSVGPAFWVALIGLIGKIVYGAYWKTQPKSEAELKSAPEA